MPAVGGSTPVSSLISVDLPAPFTPTSATRSPRSMVKRTFAEHLLRAVALGKPLGLHNHAPRGRRLGKLEVNDRLFFGNLDALDLFEFLDAALHLLRFGSLGAEAIDEGLKMLDLLALVAIGGLELRAPLVFLAEIFRVVALIDGEALVPYLDGAVDRNIEKIAIVGDKDVAEGIVFR